MPIVSTGTMGISNNVIGKATEEQKRERSRVAEELAWESSAIMVRARERLKRAIRGYGKNVGAEMGRYAVEWI